MASDLPAPPPFPHPEPSWGLPGQGLFQESLLPDPIQGCSSCLSPSLPVSLNQACLTFPSLPTHSQALGEPWSSPVPPQTGVPALGEWWVHSGEEDAVAQTSAVVTELPGPSLTPGIKKHTGESFAFFSLKPGAWEVIPLPLPRSRKPVSSSSCRNCFFLDLK